MATESDVPASRDRVDKRGMRGWVDRSSGEVHGTGSGAGGGNPGEDYDDDPTAGGGPEPGAGRSTADNRGQRPRHPLPESPEARHNEIPEKEEREKGLGEEGDELLQPDGRPVDPDGEAYVYGDLGR